MSIHNGTGVLGPVAALFLLATILSLPRPAYAFFVGRTEARIFGGLAESYDDNVTYAETNRKIDWITDVTIGAGAKREGPTYGLDFNGSITQHTFAKNRDFNNLSQHADLSLHKELSGHDRINLNNSFTHAEEPRSFEDALGRTNGRYRYYINKLDLTHKHEFTEELNLETAYVNEVDQFSRADLSNSILHKMGGTLEYLLTSKMIVAPSYDFAWRRFNSDATIRAHNAALGMKYYFTQRLWFDGKAGAGFIHSDIEGSSVKPFIRSTLNNEVNENTLLSLSFEKEYRSNAYSRNLIDQWKVASNFSRQLSQRMGLALSVYYGQGTFEAQSITDRSFGGKSVFSYELNEHLKTKLMYVRSQTDSTTNVREYAKNTLYAGLTLEF